MTQCDGRHRSFDSNCMVCALTHGVRCSGCHSQVYKQHRQDCPHSMPGDMLTDHSGRPLHVSQAWGSGWSTEEIAVLARIIA